MKAIGKALILAALLADPVQAAERSVSIDGGQAPLYGALITPDSAEPGPAVLLIGGSGPTDRDGNSRLGPTPNTLRMLADELAAAKVATLRFDKRGVGQSAPALAAEADLRFGVYIDDAVAWARFLAAQPRVTCVVLLGHSEGALIAAMAAQRTPVCGVVSVSGAGRPLGEVLENQLRAQLPPAAIAQVEKVLSALRDGRTVPGVPATDPLFRPSVQPYLISQLAIDPSAELRAAKAPVLILQGDNDLQVSVEDARALAAARPDAQLEILSGVNHVLKPAPADRAGNLAAYTDPTLPLDGRIAPLIARFVASKARP